MATKQPKPKEPEGSTTPADEDVEGHMMLPLDPSSARHLTAGREADIRRSLQKHGLEVEARRPHKRDR